MMKTKFLTLALCAGLLTALLSGCSMKVAASPSPSPSASASAPAASVTMTTVIGVVDTIGSGSISLQLVQPYDSSAPVTPAAGAVSSPGPSGTASVQSSPSQAQNLVASGSYLYTLNGSTQILTLSMNTVVILENQGYTPGSLNDIMKGDFVAVALTGKTAIAVIDNGPASTYSTGQKGAGTSPAPNSGGMEGSPASPTPSPSPVPSAAGASATPAAGGTQTYIVTTDNLKARSGPGTQYEIIAQMPIGTQVTGTVSSDGWLKFTYNGKAAYCLASYVKLVTGGSAASPSASSSSSTGKATTYKVTQTGLKVRSGPGTSYDAIGTLSQGEKVSGVVTNGWLKFTYNGKTGYCSADYLTVSN